MRASTARCRTAVAVCLLACMAVACAQSDTDPPSTPMPPTSEMPAAAADAAPADAPAPAETMPASPPADAGAAADSPVNTIINPFTGVAMVAPPPEDDTPQICQGKTPANIIIERVVSFPIGDEPTTIVLRNVGGQTANIKGWKLMDNTGDKSALEFGAGNCTDRANYTINPGRSLTLTPKSRTNPCGYTFAVNFRDSVKLTDIAGKIVAAAEWESSKEGIALHTFPDGTRKMLPENKEVLDVLQALGGYSILIQALQATGLDAALSALSDPAYKGPQLVTEDKPELIPQFPWWFGFSVDRTSAPPPPPPPPPPPAPKPGIPPKGPYTLLAPNDDAFNALLANLGGVGQRLPKEELFKLPELKDILLYHVIPGRYTTDYFINNTAVMTAKSVEVVPFADPCMGEGSIMLHDACIDKATPDQFSCKEQLLYDKCYYPFMTSALAAQWQGGFCQRTCKRCSCSPDSGIVCARILQPDVVAINGIVHGISRTLFPPPVFEKVILAPSLDPSTYMSTDVLPGMTAVDAAAALTGLPVGAKATAGAEALQQASKISSTSDVVPLKPAEAKQPGPRGKKPAAAAAGADAEAPKPDAEPSVTAQNRRPIDKLFKRITPVP